MNTRILFFVVGLVALILCIWLGVGIAQDQMRTLLISGSIVGFLICLLVGQKIWIIMIMLLAMPVLVIRGFFFPDLGQFLLVGMSISLFAMRKLKLHWTFTEMDLWRFALILCILQVYLRNPVGLNILGASSVGARPYFNAALSVCAGFVLSKYRVDPKEIRWAMWASIIGHLITLPLNTFRYGFGKNPSVTTVGYTEGFEGDGAGRIGKFNTWAQGLSVFISSRVNPLKACFHPLWSLLILLAFAFAAISGYRNMVAYVGLAYLVGIAYRGGALSLFLSIVAGTMALILLSIVNVAYPLPANAQRALSPFPGTWDKRYTKQAESSTEWRFEMWKDALLTDEWIQNKAFGDGLGMTRDEHEKMQSLDGRSGTLAMASGLTRQQEGMMLTGNYHSGPVQTIRTIGYFGLAVIVIAMIRMMVHMHRLIMRSRGTEWFVPVLFFGVQVMIWPPFWTFIFGEFRTGVFHVFLWSGIIDLLEKNLPLPERRLARDTPNIPLATNRRSPIQQAAFQKQA